jgi:hypothetical protein
MTIAAAPIATFTLAAILEVAVIPSPPIKKKPASRHPATAPAVLMPYSRLSRAATPPSSITDDCSTSGRVAPIRIVGTRRTTAEQTNRRTVASARESSSGASATYPAVTRSRASGDSSAVTPISTSAAPNHNSGCRTRSDTRPAAALPIARPAMKVARTVLAA